MKDKYSIEDVSKMSGLTTRTIRNYLKDGLVHATKEDGKWVFTSDEYLDMLSNSYILAAIKTKNNAQVFDFLADEKKKSDSVCLVIDRILSEEETESFVSKVCSLQSESDCVEMSLKKKGANVRIILTGPEAAVKTMYLRL